MSKSVPKLKPVGSKTHRYFDVSVYENGIDQDRSHGRHFRSTDDYYYGQKWQCVEFVKRFYAEAMNHRMPHPWGHARDFFDTDLKQGQLNPRRGLIQYRNGGNQCPEIHDILVFSDTKHGHLAIVAGVYESTIEMVQQNIPGKPVETFFLQRTDMLFFIHSPRQPDGWLRKE